MQSKLTNSLPTFLTVDELDLAGRWVLGRRSRLGDAKTWSNERNGREDDMVTWWKDWLSIGCVGAQGFGAEYSWQGLVASAT